MFKFSNKKLVSSLITTLLVSSISLNAADSYGTVNGEEITKQDVALVLRNQNMDFNSLPKESKNKVLEQVIERKLLTEQAMNSGVSNDSSYKEALEKLKKDLALEVWMQKEYSKINVSQKDKKDYFEKNKAQFQVPATLEARHILTKTEEESKNIIDAINKSSNKKDEFIKLAKTKSVGPSGPKGGYLGKFPETQMVPEFSKAAKSLKKDEYSKQPVKTQFGYHVIYLEDKVNSKTMSFDEVKEKINQVLLQEKFRNHISKQTTNLRKKAKIVIK